jgi:predicted AAA+ superfamily ATPase
MQQDYPKRQYFSLEDLDVRERAKADPRGFLLQSREGLLIDEAQHVPELFNYLHSQVDRERVPGKYILTGSQNLLLSSQVTDLSLFQRFLRMMASRRGQLLNLNSVANDLGVAQTTVSSPEQFINQAGKMHSRHGRTMQKRPSEPQDW